MSEQTIASAVAEIERHIAAGERETAQTVLARIKPELDGDIAFVRELPSLNLYSGLALACRMIGRQADALTHATRALIIDPADLLGHALLPPKELIYVGRQLVHHQQFDTAKRIFDTAQSISDNDEYAFYAAVLDYYGTLKAEAKQATPAGGQPTLLHAVLWGEAFVAKFLRYALPSLLAPNNLPALAARGAVFIDIHTTQADIALFRQSPVVRAAEQFAEFSYTLVPERCLRLARTESTPDPDRWCVSGAQYTAAIKARHLGADLSYLFCEGLYSGNFLAQAKNCLDDGYKAVAIMSLHAHEEPVEAFLQGRKDGHAIEVDTADLMAYATRNITAQFFNCFMRADAPPVHQDPVAALFRTDSGFASHSFQLSPAMISNDLLADDFAFDFHTADARFLAELCGDGDPGALIKTIVHPEAEFFVVDLDGAEEGASRTFGEFPVTPESCAASGLKWCNKNSDFAYFDWAFRQRFEVRLDDSGVSLPASDMAEDETVERTLAAFAAGSDRVRRRIAFLTGGA